METRGRGHTSSGLGLEIALRQAGSGSGTARAGPPEAPTMAPAISTAMNVFFVTLSNMRLLPLLVDHPADGRRAAVTGGKRLRAKTETISPPL